MADKPKEHTAIGLSRSTMAFIGIVVTLISGAVFFTDRGGTEAEAAAVDKAAVQSNTYRNDLQDKAIADNTSGVKEVRDEQHRAAIARTRQEGKVDMIMIGQGEMKNDVGEIRRDFADFKEWLMQWEFKSKEPK